MYVLFKPISFDTLYIPTDPLYILQIPDLLYNYVYSRDYLTRQAFKAIFSV